MDFWLSAGSTRLLLPIPPEEVTVDTGTRLMTVEPIELGEVAWPRGTTLRRISWEGLLPGPARRNLPGIKQWRDPRQIAGQLSQWRDRGTKIRVLITQSPVNLDAYIERFQHRWRGGHGDAWYTIELVAAREVVAETVGGGKGTAKTAATKRPAPATPKTYTVQRGDSLWTIAKRLLGSGSRWKELYEANRRVIGPDPSKIFPGQVLRIPNR